MEILLSILQYTVPAVVVGIIVYFVLKAFLHNDEQKFIRELKKEGTKISLPIRLQAYERLILFLERISPGSLVPRVNNAGISLANFHAALIHTIRDEFEHNLSQQLYVSDKSWELIKAAKEDTLRTINLIATELQAGSGANELAKSILLKYPEYSKNAATKAIQNLKKEAALILGEN